MKLSAALFCFLLEINISSCQKNPNFLVDRNTIVHLFEWKWSDIGAECENFLGPKHYAGVQVSPPTENLIIANRPWKERYQPVTYNLSSRSGDEVAFAAMISRCNKAGIRIYADIVMNHMTSQPGTGTGGNSAFSDLKLYPGLAFTAEDFHPTCAINDYLDADVIRNCELNHLRDLNHSRAQVQAKIVNYLNKLIGFGVAGFRIDSAKYMWPAELTQILFKLNYLSTSAGFALNSKAFIYLDVPQFEKDVVGYKDYQPIGLIAENHYGLALNRAFTTLDNLTNLFNLTNLYKLVEKSEDALVFVDSHVTQRKPNYLTYKSLREYKMALAFMLAWPYGTPRIVSSYFFDDSDIGPPQTTSGLVKSPVFYADSSCGNGYVCEHRWPQIYRMIDFKNVVETSKNVEKRYMGENGTQIAFSRGSAGFIAFSTRGNFTKNVETTLPAGTYCDVISGELAAGKCTGKTLVVNAQGVAAVDIKTSDFDGVLAVHTKSKL